MSKRISILHFLSNYIIVLLPIFTLCVMGPTEIYFGNYKELGFTYQEFGWKFLFFSFLITTLLTLILSFLPDKIQKYFLSVIYWIGIAGYLQTMFLNKQLDLMGVSAESYSATRMKTVLNACLWFVLLVLILFFTMYPKTKMHKILSITSGIIFGMQLVGFLSLFPTADEAAFSYPTEELCLDGSEQYTISSKENIIETNYPAFTVPRGFKCRNNREINDTHTNLTTSIYCSKPSSITSPVESKRTELRALR